MVPQHFVWLDSLPRTASGKLDRNALPAPSSEPARARVAVEPRNHLERLIAEVWSEVLGVAQIDAYDQFFELGGHSLLAMQVVSRLRRRLALEVPLRALFDAEHLADFAARLAMLPKASTAPRLRRAARSEHVPLSYAQQRLWFLQQLEPTSTAYNMPLAVRMRGKLDREALRSAMEQVVERHEVLRTRFVETPSGVEQHIAPRAALDLRLVDLSHLERTRREHEATELARAEAAAPFDLARNAPLRVSLLVLAPDDHVVLLTLHHIASDGWSAQLLIGELAELYSSAREARPPRMAALDIQYADYAVWQRDWLTGAELARQLEYWKRQLGAQHPVLALPLDHPRPALQSYRGACVRFQLSPQLSAALKTFAAQQQVTPFMVLLAALELLLHRYSGQREIRVGVPNANRNQLELESLIGFFVNTHVLAVDVERSEHFGQLLQRAKEAALGAQAHQDLPFELLVEALNPERSLGHNPLFQVMYNHQLGDAKPLDKLGDLTLSPLTELVQTTQFDLSLDTYEEAQVISGVFSYSTDLFEPATIERMAAHYQRLLAQLPTGAERRVDSFELMDAHEQQLLLAAGPQDARPERSSWIELFEAQVARGGARVVARAGARSMTYAELDRAANQLGLTLRRGGVGPDDVVLVLSERDLSWLTLTVGAMKAGAAFLALDPTHPEARLSQIVAASGARAVLASPACAGLMEQLCQGRELHQWVLGSRAVANESERSAGVYARGRHLAYVIYTSGSAGAPKGVMVEQRGMLNNQLSKLEYLRLTPQDVVAQTASQCFDISVWQLLAAPLCGAVVDLLPDEVSHDPERLFEEVAARRVTVLQSVPSLLSSALHAARLPEPASLALRYVLPTGEALSAELSHRWLERYPAVPLVNAYGPAECADDVSYYSVREPGQARSATVPIGYPIENTQLQVLDSRLSRAPISIVGELCVSGIGVGRGYLSDGPKTAERFVPDPFGKGERLYRTAILSVNKP